MLQKYKKFDVELMINKHKVIIAQEVSGKAKKFEKRKENDWESIIQEGGDIMAKMKNMDAQDRQKFLLMLQGPKMRLEMNEAR